MNTLKSTATNHPFLFVLGLTIAWFMLGMILIILASSALHRPYGDSTALTIGRLAVTACLLGLVWRLGWLEASGVSPLGGWQVWLLALAGAVYFSGASLYSFYGKFAFHFSSLVRLSSARDAVLSQFVVALSEEILFRGAVLYGLLRVWGRNRQGVFASAILALRCHAPHPGFYRWCLALLGAAAGFRNVGDLDLVGCAGPIRWEHLASGDRSLYSQCCRGHAGLYGACC